MAISTIPAAPSPIFAELSPTSAELSPIPEAIGGPVGADAATLIVARLAKHKTLLNILKHYEMHVKHCIT